MKKRDLEFLYEIGSLRNIPRAWIQQFGIDMASGLEHSMRVAFLSLIIARGEGVKSDEKILKMALIHDLVEARTADLGIVHKMYTKSDDERAARDMFAETSFPDLLDLLIEFEKRECIEAKIVKDADNIDIDLELKEAAERGHQLPAKKQKTRKIVRAKKLYTKTGKKLWDAIQKSDPSDWHLTNNKWYKVPSAGK